MTASLSTVRHIPNTCEPVSPGDLRHRVDHELAAFLDRSADPFDAPAALRQVFDLLRRFVLGAGKRIRPLFCYWGWRGAGGNDCAEAIRAAASLELFQAFALVHDDIMDGSERRRGQLTLHRGLTELHDSEGWQGEAMHFGVNIALLCGDLCLSYSDELLHGCGLPAPRIRAAQHLVHQMRTEVMIGQSRELLEQATGSTLEGALAVVRLKAAKYTIERPLQIGAVLAGAEPELLDDYSEFAIPLGEAFQLRDDILGVFGNTAKTGKSATDDLRNGKPTVLMNIARERATAPESARIAELHGNPALDDEGIATLRRVIVETGALSRVEQMIEERHLQATGALERMEIPSEAKSALMNLATASIARAS